MNRLRGFAVLLTLWLVPPLSAAGDDLVNHAFRIQYDAGGVRSLKRVNDVHDTDYIAANDALGRLLIRYRTTRNGDWRELQQLLLTTTPGQSQTIGFTLGALTRSLASRSTPGAAVGVAGLRGLNDGQVPAVSAPAGRAGGGRGGGPGGAQVTAAAIPVFTWSGSRGPTQWVQYTFPTEEEVSRVEVFWTSGPSDGVTGPPKSWRLLYQDGWQWKEVVARGPYGVSPNVFTVLEFTPVKTLAMRVEVTIDPESTVGLAEWRVGPEPTLVPSDDLSVRETFTLDGEALDWTITLANSGTRPVEIGDLAVPLPFAERTGARGEIYTRKLLRHALVAGHGSWVYWQRAGGDGPYLLMTPMEKTRFEYSDNSAGAFTPYIHAKGASAVAIAGGGTWRLPTTNLELAPKGAAGSTATYRFRFQWVKDVAGVRDALFKEGKFDTVVAPGMVVPTDLDALISLRTKNRIETVEAEHPGETTINLVGDKNEARVYRVRFSRLGENLLKVRYGDGHWTSLEFFVTEPLETMIQKRAAFLVSHHQHKDPSKWYVGVYSDWDQKNELLRSPEDRDGLSAWLTDANDDAGNARPAYLASKNVFFPNQSEIESLELYISKYLWGGMQMTEAERYPYAIYGIPNWKVNRSSPDEGRNGQAHLWRIYDYPHIVMLYYRMYDIARFYPDKVKYLNADQYLERAYRTAVAYWTVPMAIEKWSADAVGTMNEAFIPELIQTLEDTGKKEWASTLRGYWEGKVDRFVNRTPNLYGSEFAFDSTGFESTGAFAKYAMTHAPDAGTPPAADLPADAFERRVSYDAALKFMNFQLLLNMSDRGWLETTYYQLGSDYRGSLSYLLSYMSQMGGWSILDYGLHFAKDPTDYLRLGYASSLSSWALVNSGTERSGYGYWFPGRNNDGATGGGFIPEATGRGWIGKVMPRGAWYYSAEEDVGYCAALRTHATIVARDPIFGEIAYGGVLTRSGNAVRVIPRDGLRVRFHVVRDAQRLHMMLDHDGYAKEQPIVFADDLSRVQFTLENRTGGAHETGLRVAGLPAGEFTVSVDRKTVATVRGSDKETRVVLPVGDGATTQVTIARAVR
ncbi:MAG TPA: DUF5695 domain-containing protein [Vicinamibacterales bacterium]|nr:DUF5695 domain-containing protein [Vicinamibacterales bacterium]